MSPGSINGGEPVIWLQTALPLPGVEDYILMISAHLDTAGFSLSPSVFLASPPRLGCRDNEAMWEVRL